MMIMSASNAAEMVKPIRFDVPPDDLVELARLPEEVRVDIFKKLNALQSVHYARNKSAALRSVSASFGGQGGWKVKTLERKYYDYTRGTEKHEAGDWRILRNNKEAGAAFWQKKEKPVGLPEAFVDWFKGMTENNQRCSAPAHRRLMTILRSRFDPATGKPVAQIPGYANWPEIDPEYGHPRGWSSWNLGRQCKLSPMEKAAARIGRTAAGDYRLPVLTTRKGLRLGEMVQFDDHEYNVAVMYMAARRNLRPRGFLGVEVLSDSPALRCYKPTLWDMDEQKKKALTERDAMWVVVQWLTGIGYRNDEVGTTLCVERGTMAIRELLEKRIYDASRGLVKVSRGGVVRTPAHDGQFCGPAKGNPKFKPHVEQFFRMIDDALAHLPGQTGKDRDHCPEGQESILRYEANLQRVADQLPMIADQLQHHLIDFQTFIAHAEAGYDEIWNRYEHELEGWESCGFVTQDERMMRVRRMSRREVWLQHKHELRPMPVEMWPVLMGPEHGREVRVSRGMIEFDDMTQGSEPLQFVAASEGLSLPAGEKYTAFCNPFAADRKLVCCDSKMRVVAVCNQYVRAARNDAEAVHKLMGQQRHHETEALRPLGIRHAEEALEKARMHAHNAGLIAGARGNSGQRLSADDKAIRERIAERANNSQGSLNDFIPEDQAVASTTVAGPFAKTGSDASHDGPPPESLSEIM